MARERIPHPGIPLTRRQMLGGMTGTAMVGLACALPVPRKTRSPLDEFVKYDALGLAELVSTRQVSATELVEIAIRRIQSMDGTLNAVATRDFERALERANTVKSASTFSGVPTLVKDMIDVAGLIRTDGSRLRQYNVPSKSVAYVEALERSGLVILGTTNVPEFAASAITDNELFGPTRNPWNLEFSPMGSSGGAAAAVAAGYVPVAHGTDGGGSNRVTASACGVLGMKPSRGRMLSGEKNGGHDRFKTNQALSRTVRDSAALFAETEDASGTAFPPAGAITGPSARRLKIAYLRDGVHGFPIDSEIRTRQDEVAALCEELGHRIEEIASPISGPEYFSHYNNAYLPKFRFLVAQAEKMVGQPASESGVLSAFTISIAEYAKSIPEERTTAGLSWLDALAQRYAKIHERHDVILSAVMPMETARMGAVTPRDEFLKKKDLLQRALCLTAPTNVIGAPAMSIPLSTSPVTGMPIGSMFQAAVGEDRILYELAYELEEARPWAQRWAPWSAMSFPRNS